MITLIILSDFLVANLSLIGPLFTKVLIDYAYPYRDIDLVNNIIMASMALYLMEFIFNVGSDYMTMFITQKLTLGLTQKLIHRLQTIKLRSLNDYSSGDIQVHASDDLDTIVNHCVSILPKLVIKIYFLIAILGIAFMLNSTLTMLALFCIPVYILEVKFFVKKEQDLNQEFLNLQGDYLSSVEESMRRIKLTKSSLQEHQEAEKIFVKKRVISLNLIKQGMISIISAFANSFTLKFWSILLTWFMSYLVIEQQLTIGEIVVLTTYFAILENPINELTTLYSEAKEALVSMRRVQTLLDAPSEEGDATSKFSMNILEGEIQFDSVNFSHSDQSHPLFENLSLTFPAKSFTALVGESGSGKSTLISLLMNFNDISSGSITVDKQNIKNHDRHSLRHGIGLVLQDDLVINGSIRENLSFGNPNVSTPDLEKVCRETHLSDFIDSLENGLNHHIGHDGDNLSMGQRQRIAIARALLKKPAILVLDEATSSLDAESEYKITDILHNLKGKITIIIIAHRLSTIKQADQIIMMKQGKILETGSYDTLMELKKEFFKFHHLQFGGLKSFRLHLGMELDRVSRYGNKFTLLAVRHSSNLNQSSPREFNESMLEFSMTIRRFIRRGDESCLLDGNHVLILLPEITAEQVELFYERLHSELTKQGYRNFRMAGLHVTNPNHEIPEHLVHRTLELFEESTLSFFLESK